MADDITQSLDLVLRAQQGDAAAFNRLCERYYDRVRRIVRLRLGVRLRESLDSGDILQETFLAAVRSIESFEMREEASLINWLSRLAERQIIAASDYHGAKKRDSRRKVGLSGPIRGSGRGSGSGSGEGSGTVAIPDERGALPSEAVADEEQKELVETCVGELPEEYRELILLRNYAGASWEAIAEETGRPSAAAARMMHLRAVVELGKLVRERGGTA